MSTDFMDDVMVAAAYAGVEVPDVAPFEPPAAPSDVVTPALVEEGEIKAEVVEHVDADMGGDESSDDESEPDSDDEDSSKLRLEIETALKKEEQGSLTSAPVVTAHEVSQLPVTKPAMDQLTEECPISKMGRILNVNMAERAITIQSVPNQLPLDEGSVLCLPNRVVLGCVDEVFGPVSLPMYLIRFETAEEIPSAAVLHTDVFYATEHATYVQPDKCRVKGSDASNLYDEEPAPDEMEFSDDEAEQSAKKSKRKRSTANPSPARPPSNHTQQRDHAPPARRDQPHHQPPYNHHNPPAYPLQGGHYRQDHHAPPPHHAPHPHHQGGYYPPQQHGYPPHAPPPYPPHPQNGPGYYEPPPPTGYYPPPHHQPPMHHPPAYQQYPNAYHHDPQRPPPHGSYPPQHPDQHQPPSWQQQHHHQHPPPPPPSSYNRPSY